MIAPAGRCSHSVALLPWPARRSCRWWSPGRWSGARRPVPLQQLAAHPIQLADMAHRKLRRKVPRVDGALTTQPRAPAVPLVRNTSASSMQPPPASADATRVSILSPVFARPGAAPRSTWLSTSSRRPRCWARVTGRSSPAIGHQAVVVEGDLDAVGVLQW